MWHKKVLQALTVAFLTFASTSLGKEYVIYNISQDIPMGYKDERLEKSYFVNIGKVQGIKGGAILNVHRKISKLNPLKTWERHHFKVKVGHLKVVHTEDYSSICEESSTQQKKAQSGSLDIKGFMLGDIVSLKVKEK